MLKKIAKLIRARPTETVLAAVILAVSLLVLVAQIQEPTQVPSAKQATPMVGQSQTANTSQRSW